MVNGFGGEKHEGNLAADRQGLRGGRVHPQLVLAPLSVLGETTMPALSDRLGKQERARIAKALFAYLNGPSGLAVAAVTLSN